MAWYKIAVTPDSTIDAALVAINQTIRDATSADELEELGSGYKFFGSYSICEPGEVAGVASANGVEFSRWIETSWHPEQMPDGTEYYRIHS